MIKIDFQFETEHGKFADAIYLEDNHSFTDEEIQQMKEQRRDNWLAVIKNPPIEEVNNTVVIADEIYSKLEGVPPAGAKLIEVDGIWYFKE
jgi:hypothetical protein